MPMDFPDKGRQSMVKRVSTQIWMTEYVHLC